jgi:hypothetical protein
MNRPYSLWGKTGSRLLFRMAWIGAIVVVGILGPAVELLWGDKIVNFMEGGRPARERASIIASYYRAAESGSLPFPANTNAITIFYLDKGAPYRMAVQVRTVSGETHQFQLVRPTEASGSNWGFRVN